MLRITPETQAILVRIKHQIHEWPALELPLPKATGPKRLFPTSQKVRYILPMFHSDSLARHLRFAAASPNPKVT
jgi:hypothetical protein